MAETLGCVLLVGGTGMLGEVATWLSKRANHLTLTVRNSHDLAEQIGAHVVIIDWRNRETTLASLVDLRGPDQPGFDLVVSWLHQDGLWLVDIVEDLLATGGRSIRVHGSTSIDKAHRDANDPTPRPDIKRQTMVLAWDENRGSRRWLTNTQISNGVIQAIEQPEMDLLIVGEHLYD